MIVAPGGGVVTAPPPGARSGAAGGQQTFGGADAALGRMQLLRLHQSQPGAHASAAATTTRIEQRFIAHLRMTTSIEAAWPGRCHDNLSRIAETGAARGVVSARATVVTTG